MVIVACKQKYIHEIYFHSKYTACTVSGFSLRIEVAGGYYKITGESGHSEKNLTSSFYGPNKFS